MRVDEGLNRDGCEAGGEALGDSSDAEHGLAVSDEALSSDGRIMLRLEESAMVHAMTFSSSRQRPSLVLLSPSILHTGEFI